MAGPLDLRGRAVITDGATATLRGIKGQLDSVAASTRRLAQAQNALASGARHVDRMRRAVVGAAAGSYAISSLLRGAEAFNRNIFGVGTAVLSEHATRIIDSATGLEKVVYNLDAVKQKMAQVEKMTMGMSKELGQTPTRISGIAEVLAKAGMDAEKLASATRTVAITAVTDVDTPVQRIGEFASILDTIYKPRPGEKWAEFFARQMDIVRIAAAETRLSVGSTMEGFRPFSALYSMMGNSEYTNAKLLMAAVKEGAEPIEAGHTLKSNAIRFMRMTQEGAAVFSARGLKRSDYTDLASMDPMRAAGNLSRTFRTANIKGKFRSGLEGEMQRAKEGGYIDDPAWLDKMMTRVAKAGGIDMKNEQSREAFENKFMNAMFASGLRFDAEKLYYDMIKKRFTPTEYGTVFEPRRTGINTQLLQGLEKWGEDFTRKLSMASGAGLNATQQLYDESAFGRLQRFHALIEKFMIGLANSPGFEMFLGGVTKMFDMLGQIPEPVQNIAIVAGVAAAALAPLALAIGAIAVAAAPLRLLFGGRGAALPPTAAQSASGRMIAGMTAAGAGGAGLLARMGLGRGVRGGLAFGGRMLTRLFWPLALATTLYGAGSSGWDAYSSGAGWLEILKRAGLGAIGINNEPEKTTAPGHAKLYEEAARLRALSDQQAAEAGATDGIAPEGGSAAAQVSADTMSAIAQMRAALAVVDLTGEGQRIGASLAAGLRSSLADAVSAVREAGASIRAEAGKIQLNTGPAMGGAR